MKTNTNPKDVFLLFLLIFSYTLVIQFSKELGWTLFDNLCIVVGVLIAVSCDSKPLLFLTPVFIVLTLLFTTQGIYLFSLSFTATFLTHRIVTEFWNEVYPINK